MSEFYSIGAPELRLDAVEKVTGKAMYTPDFHPAGMLYGKVLGSPIPHGIIKRIDTSKAEALPGVVAVVTGADGNPDRTIGGYLKDRHLMCREKVRYIGDPVAAVAATSERIAEAAVSLIEVEYEELPFVLDAEKAYEKDCDAIVHENVWDYQRLELHGVHHRFDKEHPNQFIQRLVRHGDVEKGFEEADIILDTERYVFPRASHCFMEPHATLAMPTPDGGIEVWASEQGARLAKGTIASSFHIPLSKVHLHIPYIGGGFGGKTGSPVTPIAVMLALKAQRPVQVLQTRNEVFVSGCPRSPGVVYIRDGYKKDGTLVAREISAYMNAGAYSTYSLVMLDHSVYGAVGSYKAKNLKIDAYGVYTNTPPTGPYRALGCEMFVYAIERNMDKAAEILGIDRLEIRRKNILVNGDIDGQGQVTHDNASLRALNAAAEGIRWGKPAPKMEGPWHYGRGISTGNKFTAYDHTGTEAHVIVLEDGDIELRTFHTELGQGGMTVDAQQVAEQLKIPMSRIRVVNKDADVAPPDMGTFCSRGTFINGNAIILACNDLKKKLFAAAADVLNVPADRLDTENGFVFEVGNPENKMSFGQFYNFGGWRTGGQLCGSGTYSPPEAYSDSETGQGEPVLFYSYGSWGIELKVNEETGEVVLLNCAGAYDPGRVMNRGTCEGQIQGAFSMGFGQAVFEEVLVNDQGRVINGNFRDYKIPTFMDGPTNNQVKIDFVGDPYSIGPCGAKGIGEVAMIPVMPAIANAIGDALGVDIREIPITRQRILDAIAEKKK